MERLLTSADTETAAMMIRSFNDLHHGRIINPARLLAGLPNDLKLLPLSAGLCCKTRRRAVDQAKSGKNRIRTNGFLNQIFRTGARS